MDKLLVVYRYEDLDSAIAMANNTRYGLSAGLITQDDRWQTFIEEIRAGIVNRNCPLTGASSAMLLVASVFLETTASAYYAADYCAYPMASMEVNELSLPIRTWFYL